MALIQPKTEIFCATSKYTHNYSINGLLPNIEDNDKLGRCETAVEQGEIGRKMETNQGRRVEERRKERERITDTWVSMVSSSCLLSHVHAWPAGVSCRLAGVRSNVYTPASDPPPQTYP